MKETDRQMKRTDKQMGGLHRRFGELAKHLVAPGIARRFNKLGYHFESIMPGGIKILDKEGKTRAEIDLLLENGDSIVAVEVKTRPNEEDIEHHFRRIEILKEHREAKGEKPKRILGAIAGAIFGTREQNAALKAGFYVLEQSGDTMRINIPKGFVPREW
jgi:predicted AAA+ superfamily ATPase